MVMETSVRKMTVSLVFEKNCFFLENFWCIINLQVIKMLNNERPLETNLMMKME